MADNRKTDDEATIVPLPGEEDPAEHRRIRSSNDRDQALEREGKPSRHNQGYDQAVKGDAPEPGIENVVDEE
jgi:hypothetical protein